MVTTQTSSTAQAPRNLQEELGKKQPFELLEEEAYLNLARTADSLAGEVRAVLSPHGLSEPLYNALRIVAARGREGIPSQSIARDMVCRNPDMTSLVDRLCQAGLVRRERSEQDRRVVVVHITTQGAAMLAKLKKPLNDLLRKQLGHMSAKQLRSLNELLFVARTPSE